MSKSGVLRKGIPNGRDPSGTGYIIVPNGISRENYISQCYRKNVVSVILEDSGEILHDVRIDDWILQRISFPNEKEKIGSAIVWLNLEIYNSIVIVALLPKKDEVNVLEEGDFKLQTTDKTTTILGKKNGNLYIDINSIDEGEVFINVKNSKNTGKYKINVKGDAEIIATNSVNLLSNSKINIKIQNKQIDSKITEISYEKGIGLSYKDEFENEISVSSDGIINLKPKKKLYIGTGKEFLVLGNTFKIEGEKEILRLTAFIEAYCNAVPVSQDGGAAIQTAVKLALTSIQKGDYSNILSDISKTD